MQRFSSLAALLLFIVIFNLVAQSFQQDIPPFRSKNNGGISHSDPLQGQQLALPERLDLPHRKKEEHSRDEEEPADNNEPEVVLESNVNGHAPILEEENYFEDEITLNIPDSKTKSPKAAELEDAVHFLLISRHWDSKEIDYVMVVTLAPHSHAHLTAVDPEISVLQTGGDHYPLKKMLSRGGTYAALVQSVEDITGLSSRFYIDLNMKGFFTLVDMLISSDNHSSDALGQASDTLEPALPSLSGTGIMDYLTNSELDTEEKEALVIMLLITARDVQYTKLGAQLLWTGYRNIRTDLGLNDLLEIRRVTQQISPKKVRLQEIY